MKNIKIYGYEIEFSDLLSTLGVAFTAFVALMAVFLNHYFSNRRLKKELWEQDKQRELDRCSRLQQERLNSRMQKMEQLFGYCLELKALASRLRDDFNNVDSIDHATIFSEKLPVFADEITQLGNKISVILNVYFYDELMDITTLFVSKFALDLVSQSGDFGFLQFDEFSSDDETDEKLNDVKSNFDTILNCFVDDIYYLEREFVERISSEQDKVYGT